MITVLLCNSTDVSISRAETGISHLDPSSSLPALVLSGGPSACSKAAAIAMSAINCAQKMTAWPGHDLGTKWRLTSLNRVSI